LGGGVRDNGGLGGARLTGGGKRQLGETMTNCSCCRSRRCGP